MAKPTVGILSMQRVINYGSFLQAYALKQLLLNNGAGEIYFVDIIPGPILVDAPTANKNIWVRYAEKLWQLTKGGKLVSGVKTYLFQKKVAKSIISAWPQLKLGQKITCPFDLIVIGSDEVFNCCQDVSWGFSTQLYGDIPDSSARKVVSYAGSFGYTDLDKLKSYRVDSEIAKHLRKLESISVRDENSAAIVEKLIGEKPPIHIDPVLAYGYEQEIADFKESPIDTPYMIVYSYQDRINDEAEISAITNYAKANGLKLISIYCRYDWCDKAVLAENPIEVLRWFKFAECIVTDTFHGTIFSIITHSNFASLVRPSNENKLHYLLESHDLESREATNNSLANILATHPDYSKCDSILEKERENTVQYINNILPLC